jgi:hypothetical protein
MVIRTEYRDQGYSMGSSDSLPAGFEIRFGSLNFQATGNGHLKRITNCDELRARQSTRPGPAPAAPVADAPASATRTLQALQHLDAINAPVNALGRRKRSADGLCASPHSATRSLARRQPL